MDLTCILIWAVLLQLCLFRSESLSGPFSLYIPRASHLLLMDISVSRRRLLFLLQAERSIQSLHLVCFAIYLLRAGSLFIFVLFQELQTGLLVCLCNCTISCISLSIWLLDSSLPSDFLLQHGHLLKKHIKLDTHAHDTPCSPRPSGDFQILILQDPFQLKWSWFSTTEDKREDTATPYDARIWTLKPGLLNLTQDSDSPTVFDMNDRKFRFITSFLFLKTFTGVGWRDKTDSWKNSLSNFGLYVVSLLIIRTAWELGRWPPDKWVLCICFVSWPPERKRET